MNDLEIKFEFDKTILAHFPISLMLLGIMIVLIIHPTLIFIEVTFFNSLFVVFILMFVICYVLVATLYIIALIYGFYLFHFNREEFIRIERKRGYIKQEKNKE